MGKIKNIIGRQIFDSRGNPTVEVEVFTDEDGFGRAAVPSGASTGEHEAVELRDNSEKFSGKGVISAVNNVNNKISKSIIGKNVQNQKELDYQMIDLDGTPNKSNLGANAILGVSLALAKAAASEKKIPLYEHLGGSDANILPVPMMNIINGGSHSDSPIAFQEFMIMPITGDSFSKSFHMGVEVFHSLKKILNKKKLSTSVGDEGGFAPKLKGTEDAIETILQSIETAGYEPGKEVMLALDCAASEFYRNGIYDYTIFEGVNGAKRNSHEQVNYLENLSNKYPILSIEDGMDENDWDGWEALTRKMGDKVQLVGDDLFVTNVKRLSRGISKSIANSILIKVNQIGTLTETFEAVKMAHDAGYTAIMSHRSGETSDSTIADLAVAMKTCQIKTGSASRSDRMSKYNQLLRIEESLSNKSIYLKKKSFNIDF
tara:strand:- start:14666 stop:15958 length:1293 start_codon:yes stop_codon:yes gene_type:complete